MDEIKSGSILKSVPEEMRQGFAWLISRWFEHIAEKIIGFVKFKNIDIIHRSLIFTHKSKGKSCLL